MKNTSKIKTRKMYKKSKYLLSYIEKANKNIENNANRLYFVANVLKKCSVENQLEGKRIWRKEEEQNRRKRKKI